MDVASPLELRCTQQGHNLPGQMPLANQSTPSTDGVVSAVAAPAPSSTQTLGSPDKFHQTSKNTLGQTVTNGGNYPPECQTESPTAANSIGQPAASQVQPPPSDAPTSQPVNGTKIPPPSGIPRIRPSGIPRLSSLARPMPSSPSFDSSHSNGHAAGSIVSPTPSVPAPASASAHQQPISTPISPLSAPPHTQSSLPGMERPSLGHMDLATRQESFTRQYSGRSRTGVRSATNRGDRATSEHPHRMGDTESDTSSIFSSSGAPRVITSKINSLKNVHHKPGGGNVAIVNEKVQLGPIKSKCNSFANVKHKPGGGNVKIVDAKLDLSTTQSRVGSLQNAKHVPTGGNVQIFNESLPWLKYNKPNLPPEERARINKQRSNSGMNSSIHSGSTGS